VHYVITYLEYFGEENDDQVENEQDFEVHNFEDNQAELENNQVEEEEEETFLNRKRLNS
jgi:hypothetical protein